MYDDSMGACLFILSWIACAVMEHSLGKERSVGAPIGLTLGLCTGFIGVVILVFMPRDYSFGQRRSGGEVTNGQRYFDNLITPKELRRLHYLKDAGAITPVEYEQRKRELLG